MIKKTLAAGDPARTVAELNGRGWKRIGGEKWTGREGNVVIYKYTILNYCMVIISILTFSSAGALGYLTDNYRNLHS